MIVYYSLLPVKLGPLTMLLFVTMLACCVITTRLESYSFIPLHDQGQAVPRIPQESSTSLLLYHGTLPLSSACAAEH